MTLLEQQNTATDYMFLYLKKTHQNKNGFVFVKDIIMICKAMINLSVEP